MLAFACSVAISKNYGIIRAALSPESAEIQRIRAEIRRVCAELERTARRLLVLQSARQGWWRRLLEFGMVLLSNIPEF